MPHPGLRSRYRSRSDPACKLSISYWFLARWNFAIHRGSAALPSMMLRFTRQKTQRMGRLDHMHPRRHATGGGSRGPQRQRNWIAGTGERYSAHDANRFAPRPQEESAGPPY